MRSELQLIGVTCLKISDVFNERSKEYYRQENAKEYAFITADEYTESQVIAIEKEILTILDFDLQQPIVYNFLELFKKAFNLNTEIFFVACYLCDLAMLSSDI